MDFTVTRPEPADAPEIADLHVATWRETYAHLLPADYFSEEHHQMRKAMWQHILGSPRDEWAVRIAKIDGQVVGFAMAGPSFGAEGQDLARGIDQLYSLYVTAVHTAPASDRLLDGTASEPAPPCCRLPRRTSVRSPSRRNGSSSTAVEQVDPSAPNITDARMVR